MELASLNDSHRLEETLKGYLHPLPREKMEAQMTMASEGRGGQAAALETLDSPPLQSAPFAFSSSLCLGRGCCRLPLAGPESFGSP